MNWLTRLISPRSDTSSLDAQLTTALHRWQALPEIEPGRAHFESRYVVVNTEATGLNRDRDQVLALGAIAIDGGVITPQESFYAKLDPDPAAALLNLLTFAGKGPIVVFNAAFNRAMLERLFETHLGVTPELVWIDLYVLLPALFPERIDTPARLADWMASFDIETFQRHHALGDAWVIAQLMLAVAARGLTQGIGTPRGLADLERTHRQLRRIP